MSKLGQKREQTKTTGALEIEQPSTIPKIFIRRNQNARGREPHSRCGSMHSFAMKWPDAATPPRPAPPRLPLPLPTLPTLVNLPPTPASFDADLFEQACKGEEARRSTSEYISARQRQLYTEAVEAKAAEARAEMLYLRNAQRRSAGAAAAAAAADSKTPTSDDSEVGGDLYPRRSTFSKRSDVLLFPVPGGLSEVGKILAKAERRLLRAWEGATTARPNVWHLSTHVADAYRAAGLEVHPTQLDQVVKWVAATIRSPHATPASFAARGEVPRAPLFALTAGTGEAPKVMYIGGWSLTD